MSQQSALSSAMTLLQVRQVALSVESLASAKGLPVSFRWIETPTRPILSILLSPPPAIEVGASP